MLNYLRRVHFPSDLQTSGPIIPAHLLNHVADHAGIIAKAQEAAEKIKEQAEMDARQIRETARERMVISLRRDLDALKKLTSHKEESLINRSSALCVEICQAVFHQMVGDMSTEHKIKTLVHNLLKVDHHGRSLMICCHPSQENPVRDEVARIMAEQMNLKTWQVQSRDDMTPFEIMISTANGAEIRVSLENLQVLYREEIEALGRELQPLLHYNEDGNETVV